VAPSNSSPPPRLPVLFFFLISGLTSARASAREPVLEPVDTTRVDVERLPPEAIAPNRDLYHLGWHMRAELGGQGFVGGVGRLSAPGLVAHLALGYDLTTWFCLAAELGLAMHATAAPPPPAATSFQTYSGLLQARFGIPLGERALIWLSADGGAGLASGDFLQAFGFDRAGKIGLVYGGALGFDWHFANPHHSIGLKAGGHMYPNLVASNGETSTAVEATAYLKYVF
jgi:hypothetical protein